MAQVKNDANLEDTDLDDTESETVEPETDEDDTEDDFLSDLDDDAETDIDIDLDDDEFLSDEDKNFLESLKDDDLDVDDDDDEDDKKSASIKEDIKELKQKKKAIDNDDDLDEDDKDRKLSKLESAIEKLVAKVEAAEEKEKQLEERKEVESIYEEATKLENVNKNLLKKFYSEKIYPSLKFAGIPLKEEDQTPIQKSAIRNIQREISEVLTSVELTREQELTKKHAKGKDPTKLSAKTQALIYKKAQLTPSETHNVLKEYFKTFTKTYIAKKAEVKAEEKKPIVPVKETIKDKLIKAGEDIARRTEGLKKLTGAERSKAEAQIKKDIEKLKVAQDKYLKK
jgi:hypothetical protein